MNGFVAESSFAKFNNMWNVRWRKWGGQSFFERTGLENERVRKTYLAHNDSQIFFCKFICSRASVDFYFIRLLSVPFVDGILPFCNVGIILLIPGVVEVHISLYK